MINNNAGWDFEAAGFGAGSDLRFELTATSSSHRLDELLTTHLISCLNTGNYSGVVDIVDFVRGVGYKGSASFAACLNECDEFANAPTLERTHVLRSLKQSRDFSRIQLEAAGESRLDHSEPRTGAF